MDPVSSNVMSKTCDNPISSNCVSYKIYCLIDPRNNEVLYIGFTGQTLEKRLHEHMNCDCRYYKGKWLTILKKENLSPIIISIDNADNLKEIKEKEVYYIDLYKKQGASLTNLTGGGDGGYKVEWSEERRKKYSESRLGEKHHMYGKTLTKEWKDKIGESVSGEKNGFYGKKHSLETIEKCRQGALKQKKRVGWKMTEEQRKKISEKATGRKRSEEEKLVISNNLRNRGPISEDTRAKLKKAWEIRKSKIK